MVGKHGYMISEQIGPEILYCPHQPQHLKFSATVTPLMWLQAPKSK